VPEKLKLGSRIKQLRLESKLTLKDVEQKAKVSATHLSEIERGMTSPTVGALSRIAGALGVELPYFLREEDPAPAVVLRHRERRTWVDSAWGAVLTPLTGAVGGAGMTILDLELSAGGEKGVVPSPQWGECMAHILRGVVEICVGADRYLLKEGDSIHFDGMNGHSMRNIGDGPARVVWATRPSTSL